MRIILFDRLGNYIGEVDDRKILSAKLYEEINGEHSLTVVTTQILEKGQRVLINYAPSTGEHNWLEYSVASIDSDHHSGKNTIGTYYCTWSLQEDLQSVIVSVMPGVQTPTTAGNALTALLSTQSRWAVGEVTNQNTGGASMYDRSAWDAVSVLLDTWGGEISAQIEANSVAGVIGRTIDYSEHIGSTTPRHRFDFGRDVSSVKRTTQDEPLYCRVSPRGKGEATENGGYGRKVTIESVNNGLDYLEYAPMVDVAKIKNRDGTYIYPTLKIENSSCETPSDLKTWAQSVIAQYCVPKNEYSVNTMVEANANDVDESVYELNLGDAVQVVDHDFMGGTLELESRIVGIERDLLDNRSIVFHIGSSKESIASKFASLGGSGGGKESRETKGDSYTDGDVYVSGNVECGTVNGLSLKTVTNTTISDIVTAGTGWTITHARADVWGKMCMLSIGAKKSTEISVPAYGDIANQTVGTLKAAYRPIQIAGGVCTTEIGMMGLSTTGTITWHNAIGTGAARTIAANKELYFRITYLLA